MTEQTTCTCHPAGWSGANDYFEGHRDPDCPLHGVAAVDRATFIRMFHLAFYLTMVTVRQVAIKAARHRALRELGVRP